MQKRINVLNCKVGALILATCGVIVDEFGLYKGSKRISWAWCFASLSWVWCFVWSGWVRYGTYPRACLPQAHIKQNLFAGQIYTACAVHDFSTASVRPAIMICLAYRSARVDSYALKSYTVHIPLDAHTERALLSLPEPHTCC